MSVRTAWSQNTRVEQNDLPLADLANRETVATGGNANLYRPYLGFSNILQSTNAVNSNYNSLQTALRMENRHGLSLQLAYTWSHEIDSQNGRVPDLDTASILTTSATIVVQERLTGATSSPQTTSTTFHSSSTPATLLERTALGGWHDIRSHGRRDRIEPEWGWVGS